MHPNPSAKGRNGTNLYHISILINNNYHFRVRFGLESHFGGITTSKLNCGVASVSATLPSPSAELLYALYSNDLNMRCWFQRLLTFEVHTNVWKNHQHLLNSYDGTCSMSALYHAITGNLFMNSSWWNREQRKYFLKFIDDLEFKVDNTCVPQGLTKKDTIYKGFFDSVKALADLFDTAELDGRQVTQREYKDMNVPVEFWPGTDIFSDMILPDIKLIVWQPIALGANDYFHPMGMFGFGDDLPTQCQCITWQHLQHLLFDKGENTKQLLLTGNHFSALKTSFFNDQPIIRHSRRSTSSSSTSSSSTSSSSSDSDLRRRKLEEVIKKLFVSVEEQLLERFFYFNHCGFYVSLVASCHHCLY